jgi:hypothetical protein
MRTRTALILLGVGFLLSFGVGAWAGDDLMALEKKIWKAWTHNDVAVVDSLIADDYVGINWDGLVDGKNPLMQSLADGDCNWRSVKFGKITPHHLGEGVVLLVYELQVDATCDGKLQPPQRWVGSTWTNKGGTWQNIAYYEIEIEE